jgi:hypothetical protein
MTEPVEAIATSPKLRLVTGDYAFLALMVLVLISVTWIGILAYEEGLKTEGTKRNGEAWAAWMTEAGTKRLSADYDIPACGNGAKATPEAAPADSPAADASSDGLAATPEKAAAPAAAPEAASWGTCLAYLQTHSPLKELRNPFTGEAPKFEAACNSSDHGLAGAIILEKLVPTPAGSSTPFVISQLVGSDLIGAKIQIRLSVCDKGGDGVKVGEFEF